MMHGANWLSIVVAAVAAWLFGGIYYSAFLWVVYYGPPTGGMNVARFMTMTLEGIAEIGVVGLLLVLLARRDRATRDRRSGASSR